MRMDDKAIKAAMKKMGIQSQDVDAVEVVIKTKTGEIVISNPSVTKVNLMGQMTFQILGQVSEREAAKFTDDDVKTVCLQANVDEQTARKALEKHDGDLASAIMELTE